MSSLPTNIGGTTSTSDPTYDHAAMHNAENALINAHDAAIPLKADDSAVVHTTGAETIAGTKTFSSAPIVPTQTSGDNSTKAASTAYVDAATTAGTPDATTSVKGKIQLAGDLGGTAASPTIISATPTVSGKVKQTVYNVRDYGAVGDGTTDDATAIQNALNAANSAGGGVVYFPAATYAINTRLQVYARTTIQGAGKYATTIKSKNSGSGQTITNGGLLYGVDLNNVQVRDLLLQGVGKTGTACYGIKFDLSGASNTQHILFHNIRVQDCAGDGIYLNTPIMSTFQNVRVVNATGHGFNVFNGTSTNFYECYAGSANQAGYYFDTMVYCALTGCASESNGVSYYLTSSSNIALVACGTETTVDTSATYPGTMYKQVGGSSNTYISCYGREFAASGADSRYYFDFSSGVTQTVVQSFKGSATTNGPTGAYIIASGADVILRSMSFSGLNSTVTSGTPRLEEITTGAVGTTMVSASTVTNALSRAGVTNFANYSFRTANVDQWTMGLRNDSTNDFHFRDNINGRTPLKAILGGNLQIGTGVSLDANSNKVINLATPTVSTDAATKGYVDTHVGGTYFNVKSYGAVGDGSNDDTSAIQSAVTAALATSRGTAAVYFPAGTYKITSTINATSATVSASGKGVYLIGDGHEASQIFKNSSFGYAVTWNGNGGPSGNCTQFGGMLNMTINGNATTGGLVQTNSAQQMTFNNCSFIGSNDVAWDFNTMQDSYFIQCTFNNCGSTTKPVINIYGSSSGTSNMLWFSQLRVETFLNGAVWIKRGAGATGGGNNGFFFSQCKLENFPTVNGDVFVADGYTQQLIMDQIFISIGQYNTAYSTPANGIVFGDGTTGSGLNQASFTNIFMNAGPTANIANSVLNIKGTSGMTGPVVVDNVYLDTTANTAALIVNSATNLKMAVGKVIATSGTAISTDGTTGLGTSGQVWTSNGTAAMPSWQAAGGGLGSGIVTATNLAGSGTSGSLTTISTASVTPAANTLVLLAVSIRNSTVNPTITSVTGNGLTWVSVGSVNFKTSGSRRTIFLYRAMGASPTAGAITVNFGETETDVSWSVDQLSNVDTSGTSGSGAVVQSVTAVDSAGTNNSLATALSTFSSSLNATYAVFGTDGAASPVASSGLSLLGHGNSSTNITTDSEFVSGIQTAPSMSWGASAFMGALALEIKASTASSGSGSVTSVAVSGGTTGLTTSGGPITTSGTITLAGTLAVANGGTGAGTLTGIVKGNGTSAFTAVTAPTGAIVGTTDTQTLSNKTLATPAITGDVASTGTAFAINSSGSSGFIANRSSTSTFSNFTSQTNSVDQWTFGLRNDTTNDFHFRDNINARTPLKITQSSGVVSISNPGTAAGSVVSVDATQTLTNKTLTSPVINTPTGIVKGDVGLGNVDNTSDATKNSATATLTNKRVTKRVLALSANSATPAINTDSYDVVHITAQTAAITSFTSGLTGTPVDGDTLRVSITGTAAVALTWGASFESSTTTLPTTTSGTARLDVGFFWNSETSAWRCVAVA